MNLLIGSFLFILALLVTFYMPGALVTARYWKFKSRGEQFIYSWVVGVCLFIFITYLLAWVQLSHLYLIIIIISAVITFKRVLHKNFKGIPINFRGNRISFFIVIIGSASFLGAMFFSGMETQRGMEYIGVNGVDGIRHIAYTKNMMQYFPPQHPNLVGAELKGFHYFYDFMLSRFALFYGFSVRDLYFRYFPFFIGLLYGGGFYLFTKLLTKDKVKQVFVLFFAYFSQSSLFLLILFNRRLDLTDNAIVQPLGLIINPFTVFSVGLLLAGLALLPKVRESWHYSILVGLILGIIAQIKVYAGLMGIGTLVVYGLIILLQARFDKKIFVNLCLAGMTTALITASTYFPSNLHAGGLIFTPFLFYNHYLQKEEFNPLQWGLRYHVFLSAHNIPRLILLYLEAVLIFWLVNLGSTLIILLKLKSFVTRRFWQIDGNVILASCILIGIFIGSFFIQTVSPLDIVQFFWIAVALLGIPAGIVVGELYKRVGSKLKVGVIGLVLLSSLPGVIDFERKYVFPPERLIVKAEYMTVLHSVELLVPFKEYLVYAPLPVTPENSYRLPSNTPVVPAFTGRSLYFGEGGLPGKVGSSILQRDGTIRALVDAVRLCKRDEIIRLMKSTGSPYLLTTQQLPCLQNDTLASITSRDGKLAFYKLRLP